MAGQQINPKRTCAARTTAGNLCKRWAVTNEVLCQAHLQYGYQTEAVEAPPEVVRVPSPRPGLVKFDAEAKTQAIELAATGMTMNRVAAALGFDRTTIWRHVQNDPEFSAAWSQATESNVDDVEQKLLELAKSGHFPAMQMYLRARRPDVYQERRDPSTVVAIGGQAQVAVLGQGESLDDRLRSQMQEFLSLGGSMAELGLPDPNIIDVEVVP